MQQEQICMHFLIVLLSPLVLEVDPRASFTPSSACVLNHLCIVFIIDNVSLSCPISCELILWSKKNSTLPSWCLSLLRICNYRLHSAILKELYPQLFLNKLTCKKTLGTKGQKDILYILWTNYHAVLSFCFMLSTQN